MAQKYGFWDPLLGVWKNKKIITAYALFLVGVQLFLFVLQYGDKTYMLIGTLVGFILALLVAWIFSGIKIMYVHQLIKKKKISEVKDIDIKKAFVIGVYIFLVSLVWFILGIGILGIGGIALLAIYVLFSSPFITSFAIILGAIAILLLIMAYLYVYPLIEGAFASNYKISDALRIREIIKRSLSTAYLEVIVKAVLLLVITGIAGLIAFSLLFLVFYSLGIHVEIVSTIFSNIISAVYSFMLAYYSYEGYTKTKN